MEDAVNDALSPWVRKLARQASYTEPEQCYTQDAFTLRLSIGQIQSAGGLEFVDTESESDDLDDVDESNDRDHLAGNLRELSETVAQFIRLVDTCRVVDDLLEATLLRLLCGFGSSRMSIGDRRRAQSKLRQNIRDGEGLAVVLAGSVAGISEVLRLLCIPDEHLGDDFERAKRKIKSAVSSDREMEAEKMSSQLIQLRVDVVCPSASNNEGRVKLAMLFKALEGWNREPTAPCLMEGVTLQGIRHPETLQSIVQNFPAKTPLEKVHLGGNVGEPQELRELFGSASKLPQIRKLVLEYPITPETLETVYAAVVEATPLESLSLNGVLQDSSRESSFRFARWSTLARVILGTKTAHKLKELCIQEWVLLEEDVQAIKQTLAGDEIDSSASTQRSSSISTLQLAISSVPTASSGVVAALLLAVRDRLQLTRLVVSTDDVPLLDTVVIAAGDAFAPTLRELVLTHVELDSFAPFLRTSTRASLRLSSLYLNNLFISNMAVYKELFDALVDPEQPISKHLSTLHLGLSSRHDDEQCASIISLTREMLRVNTRITRCEIVLHSKTHRAVNADLDEAHGQRIMTLVALKCRLAFLSTVHVEAGNHHESKRARTSSHMLRLPTSLVSLHIFAFAATWTTRIARVKFSGNHRSLSGGL